MPKKIVFILIAILIIIVLGLGWWYLSKNGQLPSPSQLLNKPAKPQGGIINPTPPASTTPDFSNLPADQRTSAEVIMDNLVRNFVERAGSFSTDNLAQAKQSLISLQISPALTNQLITPLPKMWQSVTSRVLKLEIIKAEANLKNYQVTVQRSWQAIGQQAVSYQKMLVSITNQGGNWQITQANWQ
jgi:hypothetical protein